MNPKILVIKLGYSETLDPEIGKVPSLGDVVRTTPILYALAKEYPNAEVTWLVSENAEPLLRKNPLIHRLLVWDSFVPFQLMREKFDILVNLEKIPGICALADMIDAWVKYGFRFDAIEGKYHAYEKGLSFITYIESKHNGDSRIFWQQMLIEMLGVAWSEQKYLIGYRPTTQETFDVGFNYEVGSKWPVKAMPHKEWEKLEQMLLSKGYRVSWQQGRNDLYEYMDWINSCRLIVSNDSLGLHLAFAFEKEVIGLFGPTDPDEVYFYRGRNIVQSSEYCPLMPCGSPTCANGLNCMGKIDLKELAARISLILSEKA